jgi:asparagine synthetase B (glutamine-hydrolysing)
MPTKKPSQAPIKSSSAAKKTSTGPAAAKKANPKADDAVLDEVRAPFLDISTAEFALSLPASFKLRRGTSKYILKEAMRGKLPSAIIDRLF